MRGNEPALDSGFRRNDGERPTPQIRGEGRFALHRHYHPPSRPAKNLTRSAPRRLARREGILPRGRAPRAGANAGKRRGRAK